MDERPLTIGALAARTGASVDTIRYYERIGVLPPAMRSASGYRQYPASAVNRVRLVRNARRFGFSLSEIGGFLRARRAGEPPCRRVRAAAERLLAGVEAEIAELQSRRDVMRTTLTHWDARLSATAPGEAAGLLEMIAPSRQEPPPSRRLKPLSWRERPR